MNQKNGVEMSKKEIYKCKHKRGIVLINTSTLSLCSYFAWVATTGYEGDCSECWNCYCKKLESKKEQEI